MTLCGVLKNIFLVVASVLIWGTVITPMQIVGYAIALAGLVYYGVGYDGVQTYYTHSQQFVEKLWEGQKQVTVRDMVLRRIVFSLLVLLVLVLVLMGIAIGRDQTPKFVQDLKKDWFSLDW